MLRRARLRGPDREFDPAWFLLPVLLLVALVGAWFLAGVLQEMPAPRAQPAEIASAPAA